MSLVKRILFALIALCMLAGPAQADSLNVACAANFIAPMEELANLYAKRTGTTINCTFGSTGMLYGQITKKAPYDLFFAADEKRPAMLFKAGLAQTPVLYAKGKAVLWTADDALAALPDWQTAVTAPGAKKVGIANPKTAPYGLRAVEAMNAANVFAVVQPKLAYGKNVGMTFQYAYSGSAQVAFIALSQALSDKGEEGRYWPIPEAGPIHQTACILSKGAINKAATFLAWFDTVEARKIIQRYGYE